MHFEDVKGLTLSLLADSLLHRLNKLYINSISFEGETRNFHGGSNQQHDYLSPEYSCRTVNRMVFFSDNFFFLVPTN